MHIKDYFVYDGDKIYRGSCNAEFHSIKDNVITWCISGDIVDRIIDIGHLVNKDYTLEYIGNGKYKFKTHIRKNIVDIDTDNLEKDQSVIIYFFATCSRNNIIWSILQLDENIKTCLL